MLDRIQLRREPDLRTALALSGVTIGIAVCLYSFHLLPGWLHSVAHMNLGQQLAAFIQSEYLASVVLTVVWMGRLLALLALSKRHHRLVRYRAMRRWRKLAACGVSGLLAATATSWALILTLDFHAIVAIFIAITLFGSAMYWLESRIAFGPRTAAVNAQI